MQFHEMEYVLAIARNESIGKAAKELYVSQPTLSKFVKHLEETIGQPVFNKLGNRFLLTYAGQRYVEAAESILRAKKQLDNDLSYIRDGDIGELRIAFRKCGGINMFPELFSLFHRKYPHVKVSITENSSGNIEQALINGEIDLAFITLPIKHPSIAFETLSREELLMVMSQDHPYANKGVSTPNGKYLWFDLSIAKKEKFILLQPGQKTRHSADELFRQEKIKPNIIVTINNLDVAVHLASEGTGLAFAGEVPLRQIKTNKPISLFSVGNPSIEHIFAIAYRKEMYFSPSMRAFVAIAKSILEDGIDRHCQHPTNV